MEKKLWEINFLQKDGVKEMSTNVVTVEQCRQKRNGKKNNEEMQSKALRGVIVKY